jgi:hypothetical protein
MNNFKTEFIQLCYLVGCSSSFLPAAVGTDVILCLLFTLPFCLGRAVARLVSGRPFTWESRLLSLGYMVDEMAMEHVFLRVLRFSLVIIIYPVIHIHILCMYL